jgi:hypothetical protein
VSRATGVREAQVTAFRHRRHHLQPRAARSSLAAVAADVGGIQAQVGSAAALSFRVRTTKLRPSDVEDALWRDRSLAKVWTVRGTLHLVASEDVAMFAAALTPTALRWQANRLGQMGFSKKEAVRLNKETVHALEDGPLTRQELSDRVAGKMGGQVRKLIETGWGGLAKVASLEGHVCQAPPVGNNVRFVLAKKWLPRYHSMEAEEATAALLRRFLRAYGPATLADFTLWSAIPATQVRRARSDMGDSVVEVEREDGKGLLVAEDRSALARARLKTPMVRLLPMFDTYLLGHRNKDHLVEPAHYKRVYRKAGWLSAAVLVDGSVRGLWTLDRAKKGATVHVEPLSRLTKAVREGIEAEAEGIGWFLDSPVAVTYGKATA